MKTKFLGIGVLLGVLLLSSCGKDKEQEDTATATVAKTASDSARVNGVPCDIKLPAIHFTKSVNAADSLATVDANGKITFRVGEKKDYFSDPDNQLTNNTAPILLAKVDNTKPFTLIAKVTPGFTEEGLYNAAVLYIYVHDNFWQKLCFEQGERGEHRIVSVRNIGTSDDNNHDVLTSKWAYMKIASDTRTVANYYSMDKKNWQMVRLYKNNYPKEIWMGVSAQCPVDTGSTSYFEEVSLEQKAMTDVRMGN